MSKISSVDTAESHTAGLGEKHECAGCGAKFYDLGKGEPTCPRCGAVIDPDAETPSSKSKKKTKKKAKKKATKKKAATKKAAKKAPAKKAKKGSDEKSRRIALSLGANIGHPERQLVDAIVGLNGGINDLRVASPYRTEPVVSDPSQADQPDYLNTVVVGESSWSPDRLLALFQGLEERAGRRAGPDRLRDLPRELDIDILTIAGTSLTGVGLTVPHPRLRERRFVLAPLAELEPDMALPPDGMSALELLARLPETHQVTRITWSGESQDRLIASGCELH